MRFSQRRVLAALVATGVLATGASRLPVYAQAAASGRLVVHISTNAVGFGPMRLGQTSPPQTITLQNVGNAPMSVNDAVIGGVNPSDFSLVSTCGALPIGALCTMSFTFTPHAQGPRAAMLHITASTPTAPYMLSLVGQGIDINTPQPSAGPIDPRTGFPMYYSDGFNALELCVDATPPNDAAGNPQPQSIDPLTGALTPTMCLLPVPDPTKPPAVTDSEATSNFNDEAFWWSTEAEATPAGWKRAILVMAQEAVFTAAPVAGNQSAFGRLRLRADGVPPGTYRFTHPFGADVVTVPDGDDRVFETSDIGCFNTPCDFTLALHSRVTRFLQCINAPIVVNGVEYLGDPNVECQVTGSPLNQNFFRVERVESNGSRTLLAQTNLFAVSGKRVSPVAPPPTPTNQAPDATNDAVSTPFNTPVIIAVLGNDTDPNLPNDTLTVTSASPGAHGSAVINAGGTITYTPSATFSGVDSFQYSISDAGGLSDVAIVTVAVAAPPPVNHAPIAAADAAATTEGVAITITNLLANDSDPDGDALSIAGVSQGSGGSATLGANNAVTFTPAAGFTGNATFTYSLSDGRGGSATGAVTVTVTPAAPLPTGLVLALNFDEGTGTQILDHSGLAVPNNGTMNTGVSRVAGRSAAAGGALQFNGSTGMVTINDAASLDLTSAITMSAWVRSTANTDWRSLILKERGTVAAPGLSYSLYANDPTRTRPAAFFFFPGGDKSVAGTTALPLNTWTHIAVTYGGGFMRFYVNGVQVSQVAQTGNLTASGNPLRIGGNALWGEFFAGQIDDVRIYSRVLAAGEIQADMNTPVQ
jgi:hypothetical protein